MVVIILHSHQQFTRFPVTPRPHQHLALSVLFILTIMLDMECCFIVVLVRIFLMINNVGDFFMWLLAIVISVQIYSLFSSIGLFVFLLLSLESSLYFLDIHSLSKDMS